MLTSLPSWSNIKESIARKVFLGIEPSAELMAILAIYFVQGMLLFARLAVNFFLKDELLLSPVQVSAMMGIVSIPWMIKPLFGFISDSAPIFGYRRRSYLIIAGLLGACSWVSLATIVDNSWTATIFVTLGSLSVALSDVIVDSIVVERARGESKAHLGSLQSLCWASVALGGLITAYFGGLILEHFTPRTVFAIVAFLPLITSITAGLITEQPITKDTITANTVKEQLKQLQKTISQKQIWLPTLFILVWHSTPSSESAFFYFLTNELHFAPEFLGRLQLVTSLASLVGIWIFQRFLKTIPFRVIFTWGIIISTTLGMTALLLVTHTNRVLGIDDYWFSLGDSLILSVIGQIVFMPVLVLAAKLSPLGIEATFFALLMSIFNLGGTISRELGAVTTYCLGITETKFDSLWLLVIIANLSNFLPLLFLGFLRNLDTELDA